MVRTDPSTWDINSSFFYLKIWLLISIGVILYVKENLFMKREKNVRTLYTARRCMFSCLCGYTPVDVLAQYFPKVPHTDLAYIAFS